MITCLQIYNILYEQHIIHLILSTSISSYTNTEESREILYEFSKKNPYPD
jgi:hypothetical protein